MGSWGGNRWQMPHNHRPRRWQSPRGTINRHRIINVPLLRTSTKTIRDLNSPDVFPSALVKNWPNASKGSPSQTDGSTMSASPHSGKMCCGCSPAWTAPARKWEGWLFDVLFIIVAAGGNGFVFCVVSLVIYVCGSIDLMAKNSKWQQMQRDESWWLKNEKRLVAPWLAIEILLSRLYLDHQSLAGTTYLCAQNK